MFSQFFFGVEGEEKKRDKKIAAASEWSMSAVVKQDASITPWGISNYIFPTVIETVKNKNK